MTPRPTSVLVGGPFSAALTEAPDRTLVFDPDLRELFTTVYRCLESRGVRTLSSHRVEEFGAKLSDETLVSRDTAWVRECDLYLAVLPFDPAGRPWRSDGTFVEIGWALALGVPVVLLVDRPTDARWSLFVRYLGHLPNARIIDLGVFRADPDGVIAAALASARPPA